MKDMHKAVCTIAVIIVAVWVFHMMTAHKGMSLLPAGLGTK
jgi:hypothetical protein